MKGLFDISGWVSGVRVGLGCAGILGRSELCWDLV